MPKTTLAPMPDGAEHLTPKQEAFCQEYLKDLNATAAAIRAGYSERTAQTQAAQTMAKPHIKARLQVLMDARAERTEITQDFVLQNIVEIIERCMQKKPVQEWDPIAKEMIDTGEWKFEHMGALKGNELLGKHLKLFTERLEIDDKRDLAKAMAKARARAQKGVT
jgi:phage terminase small subunit